MKTLELWASGWLMPTACGPNNAFRYNEQRIMQLTPAVRLVSCCFKMMPVDSVRRQNPLMSG